MSRSTRSRYTAKDRQMTTYLNLRRAGVPTWVTSHEAYRMTDGRVGTKGDHSGANGYNLATLVRLADGNVVPLADTPDTCEHGERLPVPGLTSTEVCMDCGATFTTQPEDIEKAKHSPRCVEMGWWLLHQFEDGTPCAVPEDDGTEAEALAPVQVPKH